MSVLVQAMARQRMGHTQAITWTYDDHDQWRQMASQSHIEWKDIKCNGPDASTKRRQNNR